MEITIERLVAVLIAFSLMATVIPINNQRLLTESNTREFLSEQDKSLADIDMSRQTVGTFNKYDYLFIGMTNNVRSDVNYRLKGDASTVYTIKRKSVPPKAVYEAITNIEAFRKNTNYYDGLDYRYIKFYTTTGKEKEGVDFY